MRSIIQSSNKQSFSSHIFAYIKVFDKRIHKKSEDQIQGVTLSHWKQAFVEKDILHKL